MKKIILSIIFFILLLRPESVFAQWNDTGCECGANSTGKCNVNCDVITIPDPDGNNVDIVVGYNECNGPNDCGFGTCSGGRCTDGGGGGCWDVSCPAGTIPDWTKQTPGCTAATMKSLCGNRIKWIGANCECFWDEDVQTCKHTVTYATCVPICVSALPKATTLISPNGTNFTNFDPITLSWQATTGWGKACKNADNNYLVVVKNSLGSVVYVVKTKNTTASFTPSKNDSYTWYVYTTNGELSAKSNTLAFFVSGGAISTWWQVKDGDVTTRGGLISNVPTGLVFNDIGLGGLPGVPVFATTFNLSSDTAKISIPKWNANTPTFTTRLFDYEYFKNLLPESVVSGDPQLIDGYEWYVVNGNASIPATDFLTSKVIYFVDGDLTITGPINVTDNQGFFAAFVGGNIIVDPTVTGTPSIEGLYMTDGMFYTGNGTSQLRTRGSIVALGGILLQRALVDNSLPAEVFEFGPDQLMLFPSKLGFRNQKWSEVAP